MSKKVIIVALVLGILALPFLFQTDVSNETKLVSQRPQLGDTVKHVEPVKEKEKEPVLEKKSLKEVMKINRESLRGAPRWMDSDEIYSRSIFQYGLPAHVRHLIDLEVGDEPTIPDLLGFLLTQTENPKINYLEIGVSVGKCIYQMLRIIPSTGNVTAFDLEEINPAFEGTLTNKEQIGEWAGATSLKPKASFKRYNTKTKSTTLNYLASDEFDEQGWDALKKYGLAPVQSIYSDAMHTPSALRYEWNQIKAKNILKISSQEHWFMAWDDLNDSHMKDAVSEIMNDISQIALAQGSKVEKGFLLLGGWLGTHEFKHLVGVISSLPLSELFAKEGLTFA